MKNKTRKKIDSALKRFVNYMKYRSVGPHVLSKQELKDLVRAGLINDSTPTKAAVREAYLKTQAQAIAHHESHGLTGTAPPQNIRDGAIDFLERMFDNYSTKAGNQFTADIVGTIESNLMTLFDRREGSQIFEVLKDPKVHSKDLKNALKGKVQSWEARWKTIVGTELNRASNWGSMDAMLNNNPDKTPEEITVYKIGPNDGATCDYCKKFWFNGSKPRVYKLSELMSNGSNIGRKQKDWLPTVDSTHPNERHVLHELKQGWGFNGQGLTYIGKDHDEYLAQRGLHKTEDLMKAAPPKHHGDSTEEYEPTSHRGRLVWKNKPHVAASHERTVGKYKEYWTKTNIAPEHHALVHQFIDHVMKDPKRHLIPTQDRDHRPGDLGHSVRARHVRRLVEGAQNIRIQAKKDKTGRSVLGIQMIRHGEGVGHDIPENHKIVDTFAFHPGAGIRHVRRDIVHRDELG